MEFKPGIVVTVRQSSDKSLIGRKMMIEKVIGVEVQLRGTPLNWNMRYWPKSLEIDNCIMSDKYFKVIKDTPTWEIGAILKSRPGAGYGSVEKIFDKESTPEDYHELKEVIEGSTDYFQRVYPVNLLTKTVYKAKEEAKALLSKNYTE